jgi:hypothetical protein
MGGSRSEMMIDVGRQNDTTLPGVRAKGLCPVSLPDRPAG